MTIRVLDQELVTKIAAGEVIERPASVVKELVENSLDAGASQIAIEIHNGGLSLIRVSDNGHGIPSSEVELAFCRHATSKLQVLSDLEHISSLGFRGEALPSIAAVADIEITTATTGEAAGSRLTLKKGTAAESRRQAHPQGTTVTVHHLFHTTPARLKFMKSVRTEGARIAYLVTQFALAFPEVRFTLSVDGRTTLHTTGSGSLRDVVAQVYSADTARQMLELKGDQWTPTATVHSSPMPVVSGLVSPPQLSRSDRTCLSFFVNRRWVYDRVLARAVDEAYHGLLMAGRHPIVVLNLKISPDMVDINVHPTKREVRFRHEGLVFSTVTATIRRALGRAPLPETLTSISPRPQEPLWEREGLFDDIPKLADVRILGQLDNTYIVAEAPGGLYLVDQHAAHERILFERFKEQRSQNRVEVQWLLEPLLLELTPEEETVFSARGAALLELGFSVEPFGERSYLVRSIPAQLRSEGIANALHEVLAPAGHSEGQEWNEKVAISLACHSAIRAGQGLEVREAQELLRQLGQTALPRTCPHGRPTMIHLSSGELRRHFGRE
ncbi:MAG: DNA mismatch repair endonuclease MutL [Chloroflexota bacterium]